MPLEAALRSTSEGGLKDKSIDIMPLNMISGSHIKRGMARILLFSRI